jgi:DNA-binding CsgD family transcriptional regulator
MRAALDGGRGALISGPAGSGRSRLLAETVERLSARGKVVGATVAAGASPVVWGALTGLVGEVGADDGFSSAWDRIRASAGRTPAALWIDDAQWLDDRSAAFVHYLAAAGLTQVVATTVAGGLVPAPITALWKDEILTRVDLVPLSISEVGDLLKRVLGGPVERSSVATLWDTAERNLCLLRAIVEDGRADGSLREMYGIWRWDDEPRGPRFAELVAPDLQLLGPAERSALEVLAVAGHLPLWALAKAAPDLDLVAAERSGMIVVDGGLVQAGRSALLALLRSMLGPVAMAGIMKRLAAAVPPGTNTLDDRALLWRFEAGEHLLAPALVDASERAANQGDPVTAERLARSALKHAPTPGASLALGRALNDQGRFFEASEVLELLVDVDRRDINRGRVIWELARGHFYDISTPIKALEICDRAESAGNDPDWTASIRALRASVLAIAKRPPDARPDTTHIPDVVRATSELITGQVERATGGSNTAPGVIVRILALQASGRVDEAELALLEAGAPPDTGHTSLYAVLFGVMAGRNNLLRGRARTAALQFREATTRSAGQGGLHAWCLALLAESVALCGATAEARELITQASGCLGHSDGHFSSAVHRAEAWVIAASGDRWTAARRCASIAEDLYAAGHYSLALHAAHDEARFDPLSTDSLERLARIAATVSGAWADAARTFAAAMLHDDPSGVQRSAVGFETAGMNLVAAELWSLAAEGWSRHGRPDRARAAVRSSAVAAERCEGATTPLLAPPTTTLGLTRREREVIAMARAGLSNQTIARHLRCSTRTVESHLHRAFGKLGVHSRADLKA